MFIVFSAVPFLKAYTQKILKRNMKNFIKLWKSVKKVMKNVS